MTATNTGKGLGTQYSGASLQGWFSCMFLVFLYFLCFSYRHSFIHSLFVWFNHWRWVMHLQFFLVQMSMIWVLVSFFSSATYFCFWVCTLWWLTMPAGILMLSFVLFTCIWIFPQLPGTNESFVHLQYFSSMKLSWLQLEIRNNIWEAVENVNRNIHDHRSGRRWVWSRRLERWWIRVVCVGSHFI